MIGDTIQAISSPPGAAARGVLRISGPEAFAAAGRLLGRDLPRQRSSLEAHLEIAGGRVPCLTLLMPGPGSYTGEDLVELHLPGSPLLLTMVGEALAPECRPASPGEFTRRGFENGRMDLAAAEAVMDLIHAAGAAERRRAVALVNGEVQSEVARCRDGIQDSLALIEAGLDFASGETGEVSAASWLPTLIAAQERLLSLEQGLPSARSGGAILLLGAANAGKSSLCNALAGREEVLVDASAGSTRDLLAVELDGGRIILDSPGELQAPSPEDQLALQHRERSAAAPARAILVLDGLEPRLPVCELPVIALVISKQDLGLSELPAGLPDLPIFRSSARTGAGISELRRFILSRSAGGPDSGGRRLREALRSCRQQLERAQEPELVASPEILALELSLALEHLDSIDGRSSPEDLLDRIFAGFCLGK